MIKWISSILIIGTGLIILSSTVLQAKFSNEWTQWLNDPSRVIIDVRSPNEFESGHVPDAILLPVDRIDQQIVKIVPTKTTPIILYCRSGRRAEVAKKMLNKRGYTRVFNAGGLNDILKMYPKK